MSVVIDASATLAWAFEEENRPSAERLLARLTNEAALAPAIWPLEVTNGLLAAERRNRITQSEVGRFLGLLTALQVNIDRETAARAAGDILNLARLHRLSTYDAAYLELAMRTGSALATFDYDLEAAARAAGVPLAQ